MTVDVRGVPELVWQARREMARALREAALDAPPETARWAESVAAAFEAGMEGDDGG